MFGKRKRALHKCPHCEQKRYTGKSLEGIPAHMWYIHGIPSYMQINGKTIYSGPTGPMRPLVKLWRSLRGPLMKSGCTM